MFMCVQNVMDSEGLQICRLCLVEEDDLVNIFNPKGCHGFRLSEIIEEILQEEVSKEDGLPWTVCKGCVGKVKDFKHFKTTCIQTKTSILTMIADRGFVRGVKVDVKGDGSAFGEEICGQGILPLGESASLGVSNDTSLANPLDLSDMNEEADASKSFLDVERFSLDNDQHSENFDVRVSNVVCLPIQFGDRCHHEEEDDPSETMAEEAAHRGENFGYDESPLASVSHITTLQRSAGIVVRAVNVTGGFTKTSENIVCVSRCEREENTSKHLKKNARPSRGSPGEHSLRNNSNLPSANARHQAEKYTSAKESERDTRKKGFAWKGELVKHSSAQSGLRPFKCGTCERGFTQKSDLVRHSIVHSCVRPFTCDACGKKFKLKTGLTSHSVIHSGIRPFSCDECGKSFTRKVDLTRHADVHSGLKRFKCEKCGKTFTQNGDLRRHSAIHSGFKPFKCDMCGKRFSQKGNLGKHVVIHNGFKPFKCDTCGKQFKLKQHLVRHSITHNE